MCDELPRQSLGVQNKVNSQVKRFSECFDINIVSMEKEKTNIIKSIIWRIPFGSFGRDYDKALAQIETPNFLYFRKVEVDRRFLAFIKKLREKYPDCKLILEIPTYPYDKDVLSNRTMWPFGIKDIFYRRQLKKYIDRIATYSGDSCIFDVPTIRIKNGINVDEVKPVQNTKLDDTIDLLAVAQFQKYNGYERVMEGMSRYYAKGGTERIKLHMVGYGGEENYYKKLAHDLKIDQKVIFYGKLVGNELDAVYESADLALGSFGWYKQGVKVSSALKVKEYLAKGLPVVSGCIEDSFDEKNEEYYLGFSNDSSVVDMEEIIAFYYKVYNNDSKTNIHNKIRECSRHNCDMSITMKPVIEYIKSVEKEKL